MKLIYKIDEIIAASLVTIIVILTISSVVLRYIFNNPLQWVEEITLSLYIWMIMIGCVCSMKSRKHISIDAINMILPKVWQKYLQYFNDIFSIIILLIFAYVGYQLAYEAVEKITPILGVSYYYIDLAIPVGAVWMALYLGIGLFKKIILNDFDEFNSFDNNNEDSIN